MTYTVPQIRELLRRGENSSVEIKTRLRDPGTLARLIAALANTAGGAIIVGADERGSFHGVEPDVFKRMFRRAKETVYPPAGASLEFLAVNPAATIAIVTVPKSAGITLANGAAFVREGAAVVPMAPATAIQKVQATPPARPDDLAAAVARLTGQLEAMNSPWRRWEKYLVGGLVGSIIGAVVTWILR